MKIAAAVARAKSSPLSIETLQLEDPRPNEILVRLVATGVCHTDIAMRDQTYAVPQSIPMRIELRCRSNRDIIRVNYNYFI